MTIDNITDFLGEEYIDYLETIPEAQLKKIKDSIYSKIITLELSEKFYDYINLRLPVDINYIFSNIWKFSSYTHRKNFISFAGIKFIEKISNTSTKFSDISIKFSDNTFYTDFVVFCDNLSINEYIYSKYRLGKCDKPIPTELEYKKSYSYNNIDIYLWVCKITGKNLSAKERIIFVHQNIEQKYRYYEATELTISTFKNILHKFEVSEKDYFDVKNQDDAKTRVLSVFRAGDNEFVIWYLTSLNMSNTKFFNKENFNYITVNLINYGLISRTNTVNKIRTILSWGKMLNYGFEISESFRWELKHAISSYEYNYLIDELIYEVINLGVVPPKGNKFYDYYKQISIME